MKVRETDFNIKFFNGSGFVIENNATNNANIVLMCQSTPTFTIYE